MKKVQMMIRIKTIKVLSKEKDIKKWHLQKKILRSLKIYPLSKNQDKLIKSNGFKGIGSFINGIKNIVENKIESIIIKIR